MNWPRYIVIARRWARDIRISARRNAQNLDAHDRITWGARSYAHRPPRVVIYGAAPGGNISIGAYSSIAEGVTFTLGGDHHQGLSTYPFCPPARARPTTVGNDVWIGRNVAVLEGVTIGDGAIIGANAVVASDVRPYAVMVGNPAREIRRRFSDEQVQQMLALAWWDWPEEQIAAAQPVLINGSIEELQRIAANLASR